MSLEKFLNEVRTRADKATQGPWITTDESPYSASRNMGIWAPKNPTNDSPSEWTEIASVFFGCAVREKPNANERFIAHSRTDIEKLLKIAELITSMKHHQNEEDCMPSCAKCYLQEEADKIAGEEQ